MTNRQRFRWLRLMGLLIWVLVISTPVAAQGYSFAVPELLMEVYVQPDASARIVYDITFENYGQAIDIVDIGTPHEDYDFGSMQASIDGAPLTDIRPSEYVDPGVEIHLDDRAIASGDRGTLHFEFTMPDLVYSDTTNEENASLQITPTWFDSDLVRGTGNIEIRVIVPQGIQPDEVLWQDVEFTDKRVVAGRVIAIWQYTGVSATQKYRVGVSFPRRVMNRVVEVTTFDLFARWIGGFIGSVAVCLPILFPILIGWGIVRGIRKASKPNYLPPIAQVEGGGIKRGLTAPEAAVILELPLTKVLTLVIFGMLEKGLLLQVEDDPLTVEVVEDFRVMDKPHLDTEESRRQARRQAALQKGTVIHAYEDGFLDLFEDNPDTPVKKLAVVKPMQEVVDSAAAKMQGFDLSDTQDYYRRVIERAMEQASALGEVETREQYLDKYLPWIMLDKQYPTVLTVGRYHYWPRWARRVRSTTVASGSAAKAGGRGSSSRVSPTFGDVSASFAGWAETTMGGMAAAILPTSLQKPSPVVRSSSSGGSSCACACAGCACACACAGGGR